MSTSVEIPVVEHRFSKCEYVLSDEQKRWLLAAVACDEQAMIRMLAENNQLAGWQNYVDGNTALHYAAKFGNCAVIRTLLGNFKVDVNVRNFAGLTPLHLAALCAQKEAILSLTSVYGADPTVRDHSGRCPKAYLPQSKVGSDLAKLFKEPKDLLLEGNRGKLLKLLVPKPTQPENRPRSLSPLRPSLASDATVFSTQFPWQQGDEAPSRRESSWKGPLPIPFREKQKHSVPNAAVTSPEARHSRREPAVILPSANVANRFRLENIYATIREKHERAATKYNPLSGQTTERSAQSSVRMRRNISDNSIASEPIASLSEREIYYARCPSSQH